MRKLEIGAVYKHFNRDLFVDKYLVGSSGAAISYVASKTYIIPLEEL